jgi:hypothetical protein
MDVRKAIMTNYEVAPWVVIIVVVFTIWRAFHGPYSDRSWRSLWRGRRMPD